MLRVTAALVVLFGTVVVHADPSLALQPLGGPYGSLADACHATIAGIPGAEIAGCPQPTPRAASGGVEAALLHATERHGEIEDWQVALQIAGRWYVGEVPACQGRGCWLEPVVITSTSLGHRARLWRFELRGGEDARVGGFHTQERGELELICLTLPQHVPSCLDDTIPRSVTSHGEGADDTMSADVALAAGGAALVGDALRLELVARRARIEGTAIEAGAWRARLRRLVGRHQLAIP